MKKTNMTNIIREVLAKQQNTLPQNSENVRELMRAVGVRADFHTEVYCYEHYCYLPKPFFRQHRPSRRAICKVIYSLLILAKMDTASAAATVRNFVGTNPSPRGTEAAPVSLLARARRRPLTPSVRGYRSAVGIEIEGFAGMTRNELDATLPIYANAVHDGSIRPPQGSHATEVVCLLNRDEMEPRLFRLCAVLKRAGFNMNKSCGLHVHIDARHLSFGEVCLRAKVVNKWLFALRELVPLSRRNNSYCEFGFSSTQRYRAVNVCSHSKHGTLEVRLHSSTISYQKILAWVRLCELLFALSKNPKAGLSCMATLETLPLAEYEHAYWRARHQQLNPSLYQNAVVTGQGGEE